MTITELEQDTADAEADPLRFPTEPYPGLRPFLDHEAALLFGRDVQVREVIEHLRRHQFVAVVGGSGSGKSSLVRAGVVPALRAYRIHEAGDFWVPVICTPGTDAPEASVGFGTDTPLLRFARKFSEVLRPLESDAARSERERDIATLLRLDGGIAAVVDAYASQFLPRFGLGGEDARFLFVVDQFEELFHPTNRDSRGMMVEDARLLVERIVDHFFTPHERCYVVLTMRSEHLNDCAAFLELPDAINRASYLVRRLDETQLEEAIVRPARSYLRVRLREAEMADPGLPEDIEFDPKVLQRLLHDTMAIAHDPDHLPLLQHVLSRTWDAALERVGPGALPATIGLDDLAVAVLAERTASADRLSGGENVLRCSLERQADAIFQQRDSKTQGELRQMLNLLAFKDPNTGLYSQQRINIDEHNHDHYLRLVKGGLIGKVNYLHWDRRSGRNTALKVSHEAFIRGWSIFRGVVDQEAIRFDEFIQVLRACDRWVRDGKPESLLLEGAQLRNVHEVGLEEDFGHLPALDRWFKLLAYLRDGRAYVGLKPWVGEFVALSVARDARLQRDRAAAQKAAHDAEIRIATAHADAAAKRAEMDQELARRDLEVAQVKAERDSAQAQRRLAHTRQQWGWGVAAFVGLVVLFMITAASIYVPVNTRIGKLFDALSRIRQLNIAEREESLARAAVLLKTADGAMQQLSAGLSGDPRGSTLTLPRMVSEFGNLPGANSQRRNLVKTASLVSADVDGYVKALLTDYPWPLVSPPVSLADQAAHGSFVACAAAPGGDQPNGERWLYRESAAASFSRTLIATRQTAGDESWDLRAAVSRKPGPALGECESSKPIWSAPPAAYQPRFAVDSGLKYLILKTQTPGSPPSLSINELQWTPVNTDTGWSVSLLPPTTLRDPNAVKAFCSAYFHNSTCGDAQPHPVPVMPSEPSDGGITLRLDPTTQWRFLTSVPSPLPVRNREAASLKPLTPANGSDCANIRLDDQLDRVGSKISTDRFVSGANCLAVVRFTPRTGDSPDEYDVVQVSSYHLNAANYDNPVPISTINMGLQMRSAKVFLEGTTGSPYEGWIALETGPGHYVGAPWSTHAIRKLRDDFAVSVASSVAHSSLESQK